MAQISIGWRIFGVALFLGIWGTFVAAWAGFINWLPQSVVNYLGVGLMALAVGIMLGYRSAGREHGRSDNRGTEEKFGQKVRRDPAELPLLTEEVYRRLRHRALAGQGIRHGGIPGAVGATGQKAIDAPGCTRGTQA